MTLFAADAIPALLMVATGLVLFRRLARILLAGDKGPTLPERELLLLGVLPGLALVGALVTYLSLFHLLRLWIVLAAATAIFWLLRRDARTVGEGLKDAASLVLAALRRGSIFPLLAVCVGLGLLALAALLTNLPSENADVWVFHVPLAQSFVIHGGFAYPQIPNPFYGNQPVLFELLAGTAMLAGGNFQASGAVNIAVFSGFLLLLLSLPQRVRDPQFLVICYIFCWAQPFPWDAAEPMIDLPRACFSAAAFLFAWRYALQFRRFDLTIAALLAGAAAAGKYTELLTPLIICLTLAPLMLRRRETWIHLVPAALAFLAVASFWYVKNWIVNANPVYPFLFGHHGLSNDWMRTYMLDVGRSFDPADRIYSTNLLSLHGWSDFFTVMVRKFAFLRWPAVFFVIGLFQRRPRRWLLPLWSVTLFLIWYVLYFNGERWAMSAVLLTCISAFLAWNWVVDALAARGVPQSATKRLQDYLPAVRRFAEPWSVVASAAALILLAAMASIFTAGDGDKFLPHWADQPLMTSLPTSEGRARYLGQTREGYSMYRYIGQNNLARVLQPYDNGATFDVSIFNDGRKNVWLVEWYILPDRAEQTDEFVRQLGIHYFIQPAHVDDVLIERWGVKHAELANAVIDRLKPHSRLIFRDKFGASLYQIQ